MKSLETRLNEEKLRLRELGRDGLDTVDIIGVVDDYTLDIYCATGLQAEDMYDDLQWHLTH